MDRISLAPERYDHGKPLLGFATRPDDARSNSTHLVRILGSAGFTGAREVQPKLATAFVPQKYAVHQLQGIGARMDQISELIADAAQWQMKACLAMLDKVGAVAAAAHLSQAIDALRREDNLEQITEEEFLREERIRQVLERFRRDRADTDGA